MNAMLSDLTRRPAAGVLSLALVAGIFVAYAAWGQERHGGPGREMHEHYRTPHLFYDGRYGHGHYYPVVGYTVTALPPGYLSIGFSNGRYFYHGGVWYQPAAIGFVVVRPPVGVIVPVLPPAYVPVWLGGVPYYYANDIYYVQAPGGYAVAAPLPGVAQGAAPPPPAAPAPAPPQQVPAAPPVSAPSEAAAPVWYYCESSKSYYPYAAECKEGWRPVPATPPVAR